MYGDFMSEIDPVEALKISVLETFSIQSLF